MTTGWRRVAGRVGQALAFLALFGWAANVAEVRPSRLFDEASGRALAGFVRDMFPPDASRDFLAVVGVAIARTLAIAVAGTALAVACALPLGFLATPSLFRRGVIVASEPASAGKRARSLASLGARGVLRFLRAVPDVMWGLLFVVAIGLGPLAGTLALATAYTGVLGRVYADVFEAVDPGPVEAVHATGAGRVGVFVTAVWPQAFKNLIAYTLYSFECCVRAASVLGFIGAGGIGYEINVSMRLFDYRQVSTLIAAYLVVVFAAELVSRALRGRLSGGLARAPRSRGARAMVILAVVVAIGASFASVGIFSVELDGAASRMIRFAASVWPPDLGVDYLATLGTPILQTIAISLTGSLAGVILGAALTIPAAIRVASFGSAERAQPLLRLGDGATRALLAVLRSIPEMLWVLLCIIAIGLGPFAGTIAVGFHSAGVLGKLYADALDEVPRAAVDEVRATGASGWACFLWAVLPQARATLTSYTLLRFEANLRAATVVGLVGGGGIGLLVYNDIQLGFYDRVGTLVLVVYGLIAVSDSLTDRLRARAAPRRTERIVDAPALALLATSDASHPA